MGVIYEGKTWVHLASKYHTYYLKFMSYYPWIDTRTIDNYEKKTITCLSQTIRQKNSFSHRKRHQKTHFAKTPSISQKNPANSLERCVYDYRVKNATRVTCGLKTHLRPKSKKWPFCTGETEDWSLSVVLLRLSQTRWMAG